MVTLDLEVANNESLKQWNENLMNIRDTVLPESLGKVKSQKEGIKIFKEEIANLRLSMKQSADEIKITVDTVLDDNTTNLDIMEASILGEMAEQEKESEDYILYLEKKIVDYSIDMSTWKPSELVMTFSKEIENDILITFPELTEPRVPTFTKGIITKEKVGRLFGFIKPGTDPRFPKYNDETGPDGTLIVLCPQPVIMEPTGFVTKVDGYHTVTTEEDLLYTD
ncbi:uncharacterized protein LOC134240564 [Saccostrea cucullata]|uniref:uncharacterized protein LOC134240564 n=1 Tax=Saccostrea cuccullata TaxID=36930 RepID=UPI002ED380F1